MIVPILAVPLIEIGLFVVLGGVIGLWATLGFVIGSAVLGGMVLRRGGLTAARRGGLVSQVAGSGMSMLAGLLLIVPGFLTSALGGLLLLPPVQHLVIALLGQRLMVTMPFGRPVAPQDDVVDGDYEVIPPTALQAERRSKWTQD